MGIDDLPVTFNVSGARPRKKPIVDTIQALNFAVLVFDQCRPVKALDRDLPAKTFCGVAEVFRVVRCIDEKLFRDAPNVYTGAA